MKGINELQNTAYVVDAITQTAPSEELIERYLQTQGTIAFFENMIVKPFENFAKDKGNMQVYDANGVTIKLNESQKAIKHSPKDLWTLTDSLLYSALHNQCEGKQMFGVKQFGDVVAIDTQYVGDSIRDWKDVVLGKTSTQRMTMSGKDGIAEMISQYTPQLGVMNEGSMANVKDSTVGLYVAAKHQIGALKRCVISPVEKMIKAAADFDPTQTTWDVHAYGNMLTQVQVVPSPKSDYAGAMNKFQRTLRGYESRAENGRTTFLNDALAQPRIYTSIPVLQHRSERLQERTTLGVRKELFIGYQPEVARVLTKA